MRAGASAGSRHSVAGRVTGSGGRPGEDPLFDRFNFRIGAFFASVNTEVRLDSKTLGRGVALNFEDDLGLDDADNLVQFQGDLVLARRHKLGFSYLDFSRDSTTVLLEEIRFGDITIPVNAQVRSFFDAQLIDLDYTYFLLRKERLALGISAGFAAFDLSTGVEERRLGLSQVAVAEFPVPEVGVELRYAVAPKLLFQTSGQWISLTFGEYSGALWDLAASLEHRTFRYLSFGIGLSAIELDGEIDDTEFVGALDLEYAGVQIFARLRY
jgi:hypothetical protein